jgi:hypothetical protein
MPKFILSYRSAKDYDALADSAGVGAWEEFLNDIIAPRVVDPGWPVFEPTTVVGEAGPSTQLGGYSVVDADDLEAAIAIAQRCPTLERGGGVEVAPLADLPAEHPAEQMRRRLVKA